VVQVTGRKDALGPETFAAVEHVQVEGAVAVEGTVADDARAPGGREVRAARFTVIDAGAPFPIFADQTEEFRLDQRHLAIRSQDYVATFRIKAELLRAFREFLDAENVLEVTPPILSGNAAEGGAEAFQFDYFGRPAYLSQTAQLYLEALLFPHERVYSLTPSFRAEKSRTPRHLTEYQHLEVELAWCDLNGLLDFIERMVVHVGHALAERRASELTQLGRPPAELAALAAPFPRITYAEAIDRLAGQGLPVRWGSDLATAEERALTVESTAPIFVTHFPRELKAFYMLRSGNDPRTVEAADLLAPEGYGEIGDRRSFVPRDRPRPARGATPGDRGRPQGLRVVPRPAPSRQRSARRLRHRRRADSPVDAAPRAHSRGDPVSAHAIATHAVSAPRIERAVSWGKVQ
jgi:asparaginyl-tRNA synthetase